MEHIARGLRVIAGEIRTAGASLHDVMLSPLVDIVYEHAKGRITGEMAPKRMPGAVMGGPLDGGRHYAWSVMVSIEGDEVWVEWWAPKITDAPLTRMDLQSTTYEQDLKDAVDQVAASLAEPD